MAIEIKWVINATPSAPSEDGFTDVIKYISWTRMATEMVGDGDDYRSYSATFPGMTPCPPPNPDEFTPYVDITEDQIDGWLNGLVDIEAIDQQLTRDIQNQINPPVVNKPLPWVTE